jgi:hypothetical protein
MEMPFRSSLSEGDHPGPADGYIRCPAGWPDMGSGGAGDVRKNYAARRGLSRSVEQALQERHDRVSGTEDASSWFAK